MYGTEEMNQILVIEEHHEALEPDAVYDSVEEAATIEERRRKAERAQKFAEELEETIERFKEFLDEMAEAFINATKGIADFANEVSETVNLDDDEPFDVVKIIKVIGRKVKHCTVTRLLIPP